MDAGATLLVAAVAPSAGAEPMIKEAPRRLSSRTRTPNAPYGESEELQLLDHTDTKMMFTSPLQPREGMLAMSQSPVERRGTKHARSPSSSETSITPGSTDRKKYRSDTTGSASAAVAVAGAASAATAMDADMRSVIKKGAARQGTCRKLYGTERFSEWCRACQSKLKCRRLEDELYQNQLAQDQQHQLAQGADYTHEGLAGGVSSTPSSAAAAAAASAHYFVSPPAGGEHGGAGMDYCDAEGHTEDEEGPEGEDEDEEGERRGSGEHAGRTSDMESLDPTDDHVVPGRRRLHICLPGCRHVCATNGCTELLTPAAARSRYVRCARCRKQGLPAQPTGRRPGRQAKTKGSPTGTTPTDSQSPLAGMHGGGGGLTESPPPMSLFEDGTGAFMHEAGLPTPAPTHAAASDTAHAVAPVPTAALHTQALRPSPSSSTSTTTTTTTTLSFTAPAPSTLAYENALFMHAGTALPPPTLTQAAGATGTFATDASAPSLASTALANAAVKAQAQAQAPRTSKKPVPNLNFSSPPTLQQQQQQDGSGGSMPALAMDTKLPEASGRRTSGGSEIMDFLDSPRPPRNRLTELHKGSPRISKMRSSASLLPEDDDSTLDYLDRDEPRFYISHCAPPAPMISSKADMKELVFPGLSDVTRPTPTSSYAPVRVTPSQPSSSSSSSLPRSSLSIQASAADVALAAASTTSTSTTSTSTTVSALPSMPSSTATSSTGMPLSTAAAITALSDVVGMDESMDGAAPGASSTPHPHSHSAPATANTTPMQPPPLLLNLSDSQGSTSLRAEMSRIVSSPMRSLSHRDLFNSPSPSKLGRRYSISGSIAGSPLPQMSPGGLLAAQTLTRMPRARLTSPLAAAFTFPPPDAVESEEEEDGSPLRRVRRMSTTDPKLVCRKCNTVYEDDEDDLITCDVCRTAFHAGCEEPELDWMPTKAFCSTTCFDTYKQSPAGMRVFQDFTMLGTGHLRRIDASFANKNLPVAAPITHNLRHAQRALEEPQTVPSFPFVVGDCVSLRATPTVDDPRSEWPAVIRHIYYHRSGAPLFFVTWLEPIDEDTYFYPQPSQEKDEPAKEAEPVPAVEPVAEEAPDSGGEAREEDTGGEASQEMQEVVLKKGQIRCPCGRVFSSGQALGGHRGKCKLPREKLRNTDSHARAQPAAVKPPKSPTSHHPVAARSTRSNKAAPVVIYPCHEFNLRDYRFGRSDKEAQVPACIVRHLGCSIDLPHEFLVAHMIYARAKFSLAKLDDVVNDGELWGPLVMPESNAAKATLSYTRDVPRKLTFANPGAKTDVPIGETVLPRTRMRQPSKKLLESQDDL